MRLPRNPPNSSRPTRRRAGGPWRRDILLLFSITALLVSSLPTPKAWALDGVYHAPYGQDDLYSAEPTERFPRDPVAGETVYVKLTTWPVESGQAAWLTWTKNGVSQPDVGAAWKYNSGNNSYWEAAFGPFAKGDQITYTVHANVNGSNEKTVGPFSFTVTDWSTVGDVVSYVDGTNQVEFTLTDASGDFTPKLRLAFPSTDTLRVEFSPSGQGLNATGASAYTVTEDATDVRLTTSDLVVKVQKSPYRLSIYESDGTTLIVEGQDPAISSNLRWLTDGATTIAKVGDTFATPSAERFWGFGERYNTLDHRGTDVDIYTYDQYLDHGQRTYLPIPFFVNSRGYGLYLDSTYYTRFDLATAANNRYGFTQNAGGTLTETLDYYLIYGPDSTDVVGGYTDITGKPKLPPKWLFGPWMIANEWDKQSEIQTQIDNSDFYDIPATVVVIEAWSDEETFYIWNDAQYTPQDGSYCFGYTDFTFPSSGKWPDPRQLVQNAHDQNIRVLLWQAPVEKYLGYSHAQKDNDESYMIQQGFAVGDGSGGVYRIPSGRWFANSLLPDFTSSAASAWWLDCKRGYLFDMSGVGIDGFKTDGGEYVFGRDLTFANGKTGDEMRNAYPGAYVGAFDAFVQTATVNDGILLSRAGGAGAQGYPGYWSGDERSTFGAFQDSIRAGLSASLSGVPFWGFDLAGFNGDIPTKELYLRSAAMAAFTPIMEFHSEASGDPNPSQARSPWNMEARLNDAQARTGYAKFANIHMNLIPYAYSEAKQTSTDGVPMMRAMPLAYPGDTTAAALVYQYLYGTNLLVAPVETQGATTKSVYLPRGEWVDLWNGGQHSGPATVTYGVSDLETIPVFVKAGSILPLNLDNSYTLGGYVGNDVDTYTQLTFAVYPFGASSYPWFDDAVGSVKTIQSVEDYTLNRIDLTVPAVATTATLLVNTTKPTTVKVDGSPLTELSDLPSFQASSSGWYSDDQNQDVYVKLPSSAGTRTVELEGVNKPAFEAEFEALTAVGTNTDHPGYTGTGFVDAFETEGDAVTFDGIEVSTGSAYELRFRYSAANAGGATRTVYVNGEKAGTVTFPQTPDWDTWATASISGNLYQGQSNTVRIVYESGDAGAINLDNLLLVANPSQPAREFFQEEAVLGNGYGYAQLDLRGSTYDLMVPLGIYKGIVVDGTDASGTEGVQVNVEKALLGIEVDGRISWLNQADEWTYTQQYITDTAVLKSIATNTDAGVRVTQYDFFPENITYPTTTSNEPIRGIQLKRIVVENLDVNARDIGVRFYADLDVNGEPDQDTVSYQPTEDAIYFYDGGDAGSGRTRTLAFGMRMKSTGTVIAQDREVHATEGAGSLAQTANIAASGSQEFDVMLVGATDAATGADLYASDIVPASDWFDTVDVSSIQATTETYWIDLIASATLINTPDPVYDANYRRSLITTIITFNKDTGAVAAGFHNGAYAYSWPRDGIYAAMTLDRAGIHDLPERYYDWLWNTAERDTATNDIGNDGVYYRFWYQKYTMDGIREWEQPQVDQTASIPFGVKLHYDLTGDSAFRSTYYPMVKEAALVSSQDNPHDGLDYNENMHLMFSYNLWEDQWGMFLYSNGSVVAGLDAASTLAALEGQTQDQATFEARRDDIRDTGILLSVSSTDTTNPGLYSSDYGRFYMSKDLKKWYTDPSSIWNAITTDISMLGLVVPFGILPADDTMITATLGELEPALTDAAETGQAVGGVVRYRQDQTSRYGSVYSDFGDTYYDGGPWMVATAWLSQYQLERANTTTGKTYTDKAKAYTDWIFSYLGNVGIGAEQVDENMAPGTFAHQAAWANGWESNASIVDNLLAYIDYTYDAPSNTFTARPKIPSDWSTIGAEVVVKDGKIHLDVTEVATNQTQVDLNNASATGLTVEIYVQTDANPTSVTGTGLSWTYDASTGRVKFYGILTSGATETITINH